MNEYRYDKQTYTLHHFDVESRTWLFAHQATDRATEQEAIWEYEEHRPKETLGDPTEKNDYDENSEEFVGDPLNISTSYSEFHAASLNKYEDKSGQICLKIDDPYQTVEHDRFQNLYFKNTEEMNDFFDKIDENWRICEIIALNEVLKICDGSSTL